MNHKYQSFLRPAMESETEVVDGLIEIPSDDVELAEELRAMREISGNINDTVEKVVALESIVNLLREDRRMTSMEARLLSVTCEKYGWDMPHVRVGMALEAFEGSQGGRLGSIALESFTDHLRKAIEFIVSLLKRLGEHIMRYINMQFGKLRQLKQTIHQNSLYPAERKKSPTPELASSIVAAFNVGGKFDPRAAIENLSRLFKGITDHSFIGGIQSFAEHLIEMAETFGREQGDGENWRNHVGTFNDMKLPIPDGFQSVEQSVSTATYRFDGLPGGVFVDFTGLAEGNNSGKRGTMERARALTKIGHVQTMYRDVPVGEPLAELRKFGNNGANSLVTDAVNLMTAGERLEPVMRKAASSLNPLSQKIESLRLTATSIEGDRSTVITDILMGVPKVTGLLVELSKVGLVCASQAGTAVNGMVYHNLERA